METPKIANSSMSGNKLIRLKMPTTFQMLTYGHFVGYYNESFRCKIAQNLRDNNNHH